MLNILGPLWSNISKALSLYYVVEAFGLFWETTSWILFRESHCVALSWMFTQKDSSLLCFYWNCTENCRHALFQLIVNPGKYYTSVILTCATNKQTKQIQKLKTSESHRCFANYTHKDSDDNLYYGLPVAVWKQWS